MGIKKCKTETSTLHQHMNLIYTFCMIVTLVCIKGFHSSFYSSERIDKQLCLCCSPRENQARLPRKQQNITDFINAGNHGDDQELFFLDCFFFRSLFCDLFWTVKRRDPIRYPLSVGMCIPFNNICLISKQKHRSYKE